MRTDGQKQANKSVLSKEMKTIKNFIDNYRLSLKDEVFQAQEYSLKLIQIPKVSNTKRGELAIEFVNWKMLDQKDQEAFDKVTAIIKDKVVKVEAANVGKLKPGKVIKEVNLRIRSKISHYDHRCLYTIFSIRPAINAEDPFDTNTKYCHYDEVHNDYLYQDTWVEFVVQIFENNKLTLDNLKSYFDKNISLSINEYE